MVDLVLRNGTILDGNGGEPFEGDVAIDRGTITAVGKVSARGREEIDARGRLVTPGFVDIHTHYDGQVTWDGRVVPSAWHGVTTVVMGNCGVGFAPVRPDHHDRLIRLMEGVEDIPGTALAEGLSWQWESFPEYLDAIDRRRHDVDVCAQVPHGALRVYVMGERGANREPATEAEIARMGELAREAIRAGAFGFTSSRTIVHRTSEGKPTPTLDVVADELVGIARAIGQGRSGVFEMISDFDDMEAEFGMLRRMVEVSGRPLTISLAQVDFRPDMWRELLGRIEEAAREGLPIKGQVCGRPIGALMGLQGTIHPFIAHRAYREIADRPLDERVRLLRADEVRRSILQESPELSNPMLAFLLTSFHKLFRLGDPPEYEPPAEESCAAQAKNEGRRPEEVAYDWLLEKDGRALLYFPLHNYTEFNLENARTMMLHPDTVLGLGDGGAHCGVICDASFPTYMLTHWGRDRRRGEGLDLPWIVRSHTRETAEAVGLLDRGRLQPGLRADLNVIDFDRLRLRPPEMAYDLPAGGKRLLQKADGYVATVVNGRVTYRDGEPTGELPGRLVRGARSRSGEREAA